MLTKLPQNSLLKRALQIAGLVLVLIVSYLLRRQLLAVLGPLLIAITISYILNPLVLWLEQRRLSRTMAVILIFAVFFGMAFIFLARVLPLFADEANNLVRRLPQYLEQGQGLLTKFYSAAHRLNLPLSIIQALEKSLDTLEARMLAALGRIPEVTINAARGLISFFLVLVLSFYILRDFDMLKDSLYYIIPRKGKSRARKILHEVDSSLGRYLRGQLFLALAVGVLTYISLLVLGVEFSLLWGLFAGLTNTIPYFGPILGAVPAVLMALLTSPTLAIKTVIVFVIIQQVESNFISPYVLGKTLDLHPLVVLLALLAGGQFFGFWGLIAAVPAAAVARIVIRNLVLPPLE
ncbi:MAG TPA: AI-2E family transporter [Bacillota bacterium]|jgi:predicted PurR-regulated permease PerM|nr:AI-2E family transporter [Bacillota bacterium]